MEFDYLGILQQLGVIPSMRQAKETPWSIFHLESEELGSVMLPSFL